MTCSHERRFFFRQRLRTVAKRPVVSVVERCLECREVTRESVPPAEIKAAMLSVSLLDPDPWEAARG